MEFLLQCLAKEYEFTPPELYHLLIERGEFRKVYFPLVYKVPEEFTLRLLQFREAWLLISRGLRVRKEVTMYLAKTMAETETKPLYYGPDCIRTIAFLCLSCFYE